MDGPTYPVAFLLISNLTVHLKLNSMEHISWHIPTCIIYDFLSQRFGLRPIISFFRQSCRCIAMWNALCRRKRCGTFSAGHVSRICLDIWHLSCVYGPISFITICSCYLFLGTKLIMNLTFRSSRERTAVLCPVIKNYTAYFSWQSYFHRARQVSSGEIKTLYNFMKYYLTKERYVVLESKCQKLWSSL